MSCHIIKVNKNAFSAVGRKWNVWKSVEEDTSGYSTSIVLRKKVLLTEVKTYVVTFNYSLHVDTIYTSSCCMACG